MTSFVFYKYSIVIFAARMWGVNLDRANRKVLTNNLRNIASIKSNVGRKSTDQYLLEKVMWDEVKGNDIFVCR